MYHNYSLGLERCASLLCEDGWIADGIKSRKMLSLFFGTWMVSFVPTPTLQRPIQIVKYGKDYVSIIRNEVEGNDELQTTKFIEF
jgi:hypothetical protein